jgi:stage V sporulation protein D (sporulation-specific penicillin-binding protein)
MRRRLWFTLVAGAVIFTALVVRLAYVQLWIGPDLTVQAEDSWRREIPYADKRGEIWDRNGVRLTYNVTSPSIMAIPAQIDNKPETAAKLAQVLQMSSDNVLAMLQKKNAMLVDIKPGGRKLSEEKARLVRELNLAGIVVTEDNKRFYPFGQLASHILGFTGGYNQGLNGVEAKYDQELKGVKGSVSFLSDASGRRMPGSSDAFSKPKDGLNLQLTIDSYLQAVLERELDNTMVTTQAKQALAIMMDPMTGEILAMGSRPAYEPENFREYPADVYNRNLPVWMTYEPGSTFKIITLAAALEEKKIKFTEPFFDTGSIEVAGAKLRCWKRGGHGSETMLEVVENSCNPGFVVMGQRLGKETLFDYINRFGFGKKTGIDINGEGNSILFKLKNVGPVELATTAFGQGVSVTPIQQITAVSAAINGGKLLVPHVTKAWYNPDTGEQVKQVEPEVRGQVISADTSRQVRETLESVVAKGTGKNAFLDGYRVGGKTGTAQKVVNGRYSASEHIVSFVGFAPANDPKVVIYAAVDNPQGLQFGGLIAAPLVKNMMRDTLPYLGVKPSKDQLSREYVYGDVKTVEVPNLVGATIRDIYEDLGSDFRLAKSGSGTVIVSQLPKPGTRVDEGSTIRVFLDK